jgi:hypothetical protein
VVGCGLALAVGYWLSTQYQLPRLDLYYLVGGVSAVGRGPARRLAAGAARGQGVARAWPPRNTCNVRLQPKPIQASYE